MIILRFRGYFHSTDVDVYLWLVSSQTISSGKQIEAIGSKTQGRQPLLTTASFSIDGLAGQMKVCFMIRLLITSIHHLLLQHLFSQFKYILLNSWYFKVLFKHFKYNRINKYVVSNSVHILIYINQIRVRMHVTWIMNLGNSQISCTRETETLLISSSVCNAHELVLFVFHGNSWIRWNFEQREILRSNIDL